DGRGGGRHGPGRRVGAGAFGIDRAPARRAARSSRYAGARRAVPPAVAADASRGGRGRPAAGCRMTGATGLGAAGETFSLRLSLAVPAGELDAWFVSASDGHRAVYASGAVLPRDEEAVRLVTRWKEAGQAITLQRRDPADRRRFLFLVEKRAG